VLIHLKLIFSNQNSSKISFTLGQVHENGMEKEFDPKQKATVILGAGWVCQPAAQMLSSFGSSQWYKTLLEDDFEDQIDVDIILGSLYLKDAEQVFWPKYLLVH
jgi:alpha-aminoadipic semialdehyde synthase